ncbi:hypothetical protein GKZ90_0018580 [Flavobacterium sp. MC2016-06]|uniref:hypothetical protein n=1 Tax=Flavobacterium sp. MC2016-06 TaxID=2676308 RepID=UPI0012BAA1FE|nr:hypothetical protein [Flavobacterium sp. MC2016-06]MBU3858468.1 hypothetical protein [Flavobacterium sp. MC2016-06]
MKNIFLTLLSMFCVTVSSQKSIENNIYIQSFDNQYNNLHTDNKGNLIFFDKVYSKYNLKTGLIEQNDSLTLKKISLSNQKYSYYIKITYEKDSTKRGFDLKSFNLCKTIALNGLKKIKFKKIPVQKKVFECNESRYNNVLVLKSFFLTHAFISQDDKGDKYLIKLIDENCDVLYNETCEINSLFSDEEKFLIIKNKNKIIVVYDKYM